jgi:hypothetical protein
MKIAGIITMLLAFMAGGCALARGYKVYLAYDFPELLNILLESATHPTTYALGATTLFFAGLWLYARGGEGDASSGKDI